MSELTAEQRATVIVLTHKLAQLSVSAEFVQPVSVGPILTVYRFMPTGKTRIAHLEALSQDLAASLGVQDVLVKRIPGEVSVGVFVPNKERAKVYWRDLIGGRRDDMAIPLLLGIDYLGNKVEDDLSVLPHLLIAGSTGGGKSTLINSILTTNVLHYSPDEMRFALSDTKGVEFPIFNSIPHLWQPTATTIDETHSLFDDLITELARRAVDFQRAEVKNIHEYNDKVGRSQPKAKKPYILVVIDEVADILSDKRPSIIEKDGKAKPGPMLGKIAEGKLCSIAAKARFTGIHIIAATQRPSVKIIEGDIKANFPARLSFRLPSEADSRTVLGVSGAEHLLTRGDMLYISPSRTGMQRLHAPLAESTDVTAALEYARAQAQRR